MRTCVLALNILFCGGFMSGCATNTVAPLAAEHPHRMEIHGESRSDPYFWLKERENPLVIEYLKEENAYTEKMLQPAKALREKVAAELRARIKQDESSYPFFLYGYYYQLRYEANKEYPLYVRRKGSLTAPEEILLDENELAKGHDFFDLGAVAVSPDSSKIIYAVDTAGRHFYDLYVKDLVTGKLIGEPLQKTAGEFVWANDNKTFFYTKQHPETLRSQWVYRHELGSAKDELVYEETDEAFSASVTGTRTHAFIFIASGSTTSNEWRMIDANKPKSDFQVFLPREKDHEYSVTDGGDGFYIVTNWQAKNFRLMRAPARPTRKEDWKTVVPHRPEVLLEDATFFETHYVLSERFKGLTQLSVVDRKTGQADHISFPDPAFLVGVSTNPNFSVDFFRYSYQSLNRPSSIFDYHFDTKASELRKEAEVPTYDSSQYVSERIWAVARDGAWIPVSLVYKKGFVKNGKAPILIYGYGSYGISSEPGFSRNTVSLLDRGFVYAIPHVRGGSEMGRAWYEQGRLLKKMNTFTDFIDSTEHLIREQYCDPKRIYASGGSAGGLLMGVIANQRPDLYRGILADVPFVDVLTTMLDETLPLTVGEYEEWGNPKHQEFYKYMAQYSPYDNVTAKAYPNLLITTGLNDAAVQYWEPAKWTAKLRKLKTDKNLLLLHTELDAGHQGASGRFQAQDVVALEYAFLLMLDGQKD